MLNDSGSPHSDLRKLSEWHNLPETQEVLRHLKDLADRALGVVTGSPLKIINPDGSPADGTKVSLFQNRLIGEYKGLLELSRLIEARTSELTERVAMLDKQQTEQTK